MGTNDEIAGRIARLIATDPADLAERFATLERQLADSRAEAGKLRRHLVEMQCKVGRLEGEALAAPIQTTRKRTHKEQI